jgi:hypothetical protein
MKTPEDEAFDELAKKQGMWGGGFQAKRQMAADKQREWVGLTNAEIAQGNKESWVDEQAWQSAVWWAEAKLKEKNT